MLTRSAVWRRINQISNTRIWQTTKRHLSQTFKFFYFSQKSLVMEVPTSWSVSPYMDVSYEVGSAVSCGRPVVALETTLLTHGLPYPHNMNTVKEVEEIVRSHNVVPATIGILDGKIYVGMSSDQLDLLAELSDLGRAVKVSRRDIAHTLSQGGSGGTTVAATMWCAERVGVPIFVTGGLGGVHRGGETTMDVSADVVELGRTPVAVVCAGIKSILDIGRTLEALETEGVAVATLGESRDFPAFFSPASGFQAPFHVKSVKEAAKLIDTSLGVGVGSGVVVAVPIPEEMGAEGSEIETAIQQALVSAQDKGIVGRDVTPYVLQRVSELTGGKSLQANISLLRHNADVGSQIASELARLRSGAPKRHSSYPGDRDQECTNSVSIINDSHQESEKTAENRQKTAEPVVVGASIFDFIVKVDTPEIKSEGTNPGSMHQSSGGVARNIAECMCRSGATPFFISAICDDLNGRSLGTDLSFIGIVMRRPLSGVRVSPSLPTASYCVLLNSHGEMCCGVGDMAIHNTITPKWVGRFESKLKAAPVVCADGNIPIDTLQYICEVCHKNKVPVWFEPTGPDKALALLQDGVLDRVHYISPNLSELRSLCNHLFQSHTTRKPISDLTLQDKLGECADLVPPLLAHVPQIFASLGRDGVVWGRREGGRERLSHYSTLGQPFHNQPVSVSGAGDSFVGGVLSGLVRGLTHDLAIKAGLRAANLSVVSMHSVSTDVKPHLFSEAALREWAPWQPQEIDLSS